MFVEKLIKLEIFDKNKDFDENFKIFKKNYFFLREQKINLILDKVSEIDNKNPVYGTIYEKWSNSNYDGSINIRDISHIVEDVYKKEGRYYADIKLLGSINGMKLMELDPNELCLIPIYLHDLIHTLDISIKESVIYNRILNRK